MEAKVGVKGCASRRVVFVDGAWLATAELKFTPQAALGPSSAPLAVRKVTDEFKTLLTTASLYDLNYQKADHV